MSRRSWSWAGHCSARCSAVLSAPLPCGQVAESWHLIRCRYPASNREWQEPTSRTGPWFSHVASVVTDWHCQRAPYGFWYVGRWDTCCQRHCWCCLTAAQAKLRSVGAVDCGNVVPVLTSRSASVLPSRPTCPEIHWTLTRFDEPMVARTIQMELHMVSVQRAGPLALSQRGL